MFAVGAHVVSSTFLNIENGFKALTLGHTQGNSSCAKHEYLGTQRIIDDLRKIPGFSNGYVELKGLLRDTNGFICGIIPQKI